MKLFSSRRRGIRLAFVACVAGFAAGTSLVAQDSQAPARDEHQPLVSEKINDLAHRLMDAGVKANALAGGDLKPWHIKIQYQLLMPGSPKPVSGVVEEWHASEYQWRRDFSGNGSGLNGTEWSLSKLEHYETKSERQFIGRRFITLRIARPVIDPLYQSANIKPEYEMDVRLLKAGLVTLNCVSVLDPKRYAEETNPDWLFPMMCFDGEHRLWLTNAGDTSVQFEDIQPFHDRAVARDVKVIANGSLSAEMKVAVLEDWNPANKDFLKLSKDAIGQPYTIEPGHAMPESVSEVGAHVPLAPNGFPYQGVALLNILIHKDGSVKVDRDRSFGPSRQVLDSVEIAVNQWKYKPYVVDGEPVEVMYSVVYKLDGKPFVPSYEREKAEKPAATGPDDYWSAYDPKRDPEKDLAMAEAAAAKAHKRILLEVGGDWCVWCKYLDKFFADHADVQAARDAGFVVMKVNMSPLNENHAFLDRYPKIPAYPYLFVLDADGKMLAGKKTGEMEECCKTYSGAKMKEFLLAWKAE